MNGAGGDSTDDKELSAEREEALLEAILRHQVGIDAFCVGPLLDLEPPRLRWRLVGPGLGGVG